MGFLRQQKIAVIVACRPASQKPGGSWSQSCSLKACDRRKKANSGVDASEVAEYDSPRFTNKAMPVWKAARPDCQAL